MEMYSSSLIISIIIGVTQVAKTAGLPKKFAPLFSLLIGIILCLFLEPNKDIKQGILNGVISGLTASGLFSGYKSMTKKQ